MDHGSVPWHGMEVRDPCLCKLISLHAAQTDLKLLHINSPISDLCEKDDKIWIFIRLFGLIREIRELYSHHFYFLSYNLFKNQESVILSSF